MKRVFDPQLLQIEGRSRSSIACTATNRALQKDSASKSPSRMRANIVSTKPSVCTGSMHSSWDDFTYKELTFSRSCWEACRRVWPEEIHCLAKPTYNPKPCSCIQSHTCSRDQRANGASSSLENMNPSLESFLNPVEQLKLKVSSSYKPLLLSILVNGLGF